MKFSEELVQHAIRLLGSPPSDLQETKSVDMRRAVSAAYYALFHHLSQAAVDQMAPHAPARTANRIHRWLDHGEMKKICREFSEAQFNQPLRDLLGTSVSEDMQVVAVSFIKLQEARHSADYDLAYELNWDEAWELITMAVNAIKAWERLAPSAESNIFVLSLVLWKKWDSVRA